MMKTDRDDDEEMALYFPYGKTETEYLKRKDKRMGELIDAVGHIDREVDGDLFSSVVHQIVGQQISMKALETIWARMKTGLGTIDAETIAAASTKKLQGFGISGRKAQYIREFANKVRDGAFDPAGLRDLSDEEAIAALVSLRGVGVWTAQMILLFGLQRPNVFSFDDFALKKGLCLLYHHREISRAQFETYRRRYAPYGSVASLYLWALAGKERL